MIEMRYNGFFLETFALFFIYLQYFSNVNGYFNKNSTAEVGWQTNSSANFLKFDELAKNRSCDNDTLPNINTTFATELWSKLLSNDINLARNSQESSSIKEFGQKIGHGSVVSRNSSQNNQNFENIDQKFQSDLPSLIENQTSRSLEDMRNSWEQVNSEKFGDSSKTHQNKKSAGMSEDLANFEQNVENTQNFDHSYTKTYGQEQGSWSSEQNGQAQFFGAYSERKFDVQNANSNESYKYANSESQKTHQSKNLSTEQKGANSRTEEQTNDQFSESSHGFSGQNHGLSSQNEHLGQENSLQNFGIFGEHSNQENSNFSGSNSEFSNQKDSEQGKSHFYGTNNDFSDQNFNGTLSKGIQSLDSTEKTRTQYNDSNKNGLNGVGSRSSENQAKNNQDTHGSFDNSNWGSTSRRNSAMEREQIMQILGEEYTNNRQFNQEDRKTVWNSIRQRFRGIAFGKTNENNINVSQNFNKTLSEKREHGNMGEENCTEIDLTDEKSNFTDWMAWLFGKNESWDRKYDWDGNSTEDLFVKNLIDNKNWTKNGQKGDGELWTKNDRETNSTGWLAWFMNTTREWGRKYDMEDNHSDKYSNVVDKNWTKNTQNWTQNGEENSTDWSWKTWLFGKNKNSDQKYDWDDNFTNDLVKNFSYNKNWTKNAQNSAENNIFWTKNDSFGGENSTEWIFGKNKKWGRKYDWDTEDFSNASSKSWKDADGNGHWNTYFNGENNKERNFSGEKNWTDHESSLYSQKNIGGQKNRNDREGSENDHVYKNSEENKDFEKNYGGGNRNENSKDFQGREHIDIDYERQNQVENMENRTYTRDYENIIHYTSYLSENSNNNSKNKNSNRVVEGNSLYYSDEKHLGRNIFSHKNDSWNSSTDQTQDKHGEWVFEKNSTSMDFSKNSNMHNFENHSNGQETHKNAWLTVSSNQSSSWNQTLPGGLTVKFWLCDNEDRKTNITGIKKPLVNLEVDGEENLTQMDKVQVYREWYRESMTQIQALNNGTGSCSVSQYRDNMFCYPGPRLDNSNSTSIVYCDDFQEKYEQAVDEINEFMHVLGNTDDLVEYLRNTSIPSICSLLQNEKENLSQLQTIMANTKAEANLNKKLTMVTELTNILPENGINSNNLETVEAGIIAFVNKYLKTSNVDINDAILQILG